MDSYRNRTLYPKWEIDSNILIQINNTRPCINKNRMPRKRRIQGKVRITRMLRIAKLMKFLKITKYLN